MTQYTNNPFVFVDESNIHGRGLFARMNIRQGTLIGYYAGPQTRQNGMHVLWVEAEGEDEWLGYDGCNELRFMNHADHPNGEMEGLDLYALRDIQKGEEITINYGEAFAHEVNGS